MKEAGKLKIENLEPRSSMLKIYTGWKGAGTIAVWYVSLTQLSSVMCCFDHCVALIGLTVKRVASLTLELQLIFGSQPGVVTS